MAGAALATGPAAAEVFIDVGLQSTDYEVKIPGIEDELRSTHTSPHLGVGVRRYVGERSSIGVRIELDDVDSTLFAAVRAFDYSYRLSERFAFTAFFGAARLDLATPGFGYYFGGGMLLKDVMPSWDAGLELRIGDKVARDNLLPEDPGTPGLGTFHDVTSVSLYLSYRLGGGRGRGAAE